MNDLSDREMAQQIAGNLLRRTAAPEGKGASLLLGMSTRLLFLWAMLQRSRRYLLALQKLDDQGLADVGDSTLRTIWEYVVTARWFADNDANFEVFARSHARDLRLLSEKDKGFAELLDGLREVLGFEFEGEHESKLPQIEQRLPKHFRSQLYHLYRDLSARVHPTILGAMLAIDLDDDDDWVLVDHPRDWDVPSGDYLLLGCFLVWSLAQTIESTVNSLKAEGQEWLRLFDLDETAGQIVERLTRFLQSDHSDQNGTESV